MEEAMCINIPALRSLHRFGDIFEEAIRQIQSTQVELVPDRSARDGIGRHWYGMRCHVTSKRTGQRFYLHTGLIFLPETRTGLMVELDQKSNQGPYTQVWNTLKERPEFEINRDEAEYLKLFLPDQTFSVLNEAAREEQLAVLSRYFQSCAEAIAEAADAEAFRLTYQDLGNTYRLALAFEEVLRTAGTGRYSVEICKADPDNFGRYASGYRYYLRSLEEDIELYAYFGGIYSYQKEPAGIFAEIDWLNNQKAFDRAFANIKEGERYRISVKEPKFIKLFLKPEQEAAFNGMDYPAQLQCLADFLRECNTRLLEAASTSGN